MATVYDQARQQLGALDPYWFNASDAEIKQHLIDDPTIFSGNDPIRTAITGGFGIPTSGQAPIDFNALLPSGVPTLQGRQFVQGARQSPDILGSIYAGYGFPYASGWNPETGMAGYVPTNYGTSNITEEQRSAYYNDPRFQSLLATPFVQALMGQQQVAGQQGLGTDPLLALPQNNQIPYEWFQGQTPDIQRVIRNFYPGLTDTQFYLPFRNALESMSGTGPSVNYNA